MKTRGLVGVLCTFGLLVGAAPAVAQGHPCDAPPVGPFVLLSGSKVTVGWCSNPITMPVSGWKVTIDNGAPVKLAVLLPKVAANTAGLAYFETVHPTPVQKGTHTVGVYAYRVDPISGLDVDGLAGSVPFDAVDPVSAPPAPVMLRVK
jgi:hypothetical protein